MDLKKLVKEAYEIAREKGWHDTEVSFSDHIANIHAELSEAWEEWRNNQELNEIYYECKYIKTGVCDNAGDCDECKGIDCKHAKPCGIPVELADVIIRVCDTLGSLGVNTNQLKTRFIGRNIFNFSGLINVGHIYLDKALTLKNSTDYLYTLIIEIQAFCNCYIWKLDLEKAIELKMAYNKTRPRLHGGKRV